MPSLTLRALLHSRSGSFGVVKAFCEAAKDTLRVADQVGKVLYGPEGSTESGSRFAIDHDGKTLGYVLGSGEPASALALLLQHLLARESEKRALASETLHLYREINLIEQLSERLTAILNLPSIGESALEQAQRLISATHGCVLVAERTDGILSTIASFAASSEEATPVFAPESMLASSILERGIAEILNNCGSDSRASGSELGLKALIGAPLRAGQRSIGLIALASTSPDASYTAADLKLLNTIALQAAGAMENALLCAEMVDTARERAAYAAELQAASSVQQLLLQSASRATPGFQVESVYLPASEVGGDFFFVFSAPDGPLTAIVGDVSGKGLTAAMRVAMILGVLRRETSYDPADILFSLNNALAAQEQLGFATACCIRVAPTGEYDFANAGHIAPYLSGRELELIPALPLGIVPEQTYELVQGKLGGGERIVLVSDGVPEARSHSGELFGFERLASLTQQPVREIAETAQRFGQEDDITVFALTIAPR